MEKHALSGIIYMREFQGRAAYVLRAEVGVPDVIALSARRRASAGRYRSDGA
jgi:hypothetical protein